jgi:hypothetical protein
MVKKMEADAWHITQVPSTMATSRIHKFWLRVPLTPPQITFCYLINIPIVSNPKPPAETPQALGILD